MHGRLQGAHAALDVHQALVQVVLIAKGRLDFVEGVQHHAAIVGHGHLLLGIPDGDLRDLGAALVDRNLHADGAVAQPGVQIQQRHHVIAEAPDFQLEGKIRQ